MSLDAKDTVGPYLVAEFVGAGGMGEVWRAVDARLGRSVALKVLPDALAADPRRLARLEREARVLASLSHSNIAQLYGVEEHRGRRLLVMEWIDGEDLAHRLARGAIPIDEALAIARQIAEALEEAHGRGIIHRDLKPANIKVTPDGRVKVLDFGLAKVRDATPSDDLELQTTAVEADTLTGVGAVVGTAPYMSPEQARGRPVDRQTDIWAFGVVLYELLTGRRPFKGETHSDVFASILRTDPDWSALPPETPPSIRRLLTRCLQRDPKERLHDIADARLDVAERPEGAAPPVPPPRPRKGVVALAAVGGVVLGAALAYLAVWSLDSRPLAAVRRFEIPVERLDTEAGRSVLSPDGRRVAYVAAQKLWVRDLDRVEPRVLATKSGIIYPCWSPDSREIAFVSEGRLWRIPATGGDARVAATVQFNPAFTSSGGVWRSDGRIVFAPAALGRPLLSVRAEGGDFAEVPEARPDADSSFHNPSALPGGGLLAVVEHRVRGRDTIVALAGGRTRVLLHLENESLQGPVYSPSGHVLYQRLSGNTGVWAFPFDIGRLERTGEPFLVAAEATWPSVSADGTLLFSRLAREPHHLAWIDRGGTVRKVVDEAGGFVDYAGPELSADGKRVAVVASDSREGTRLYAGSVGGGLFTRLSHRYSGPSSLAWLPERDRILFDVTPSRNQQEEGGIHACRADGTGGETLVVAGGWQPSVTRDGKWLLYVRIDEKTLYDVYALPLAAGGLPAPGATPEPLIVEPDNQMRPRVSPDGRLIAFVSNVDGRYNLHVRPFPQGNGDWQVSASGAHRHAWSADGSRLYWENVAALWEAEVSSRPTVQVGPPRMLFALGVSGPLLENGFAVSPDDQRFLVVQPVRDASARPPTLTIVENWSRDDRTAGAHRP